MASEPDQGITPPTHYYSFLGVSVQRDTEKRCVGARGREREREPLISKQWAIFFLCYWAVE
jgi:hypothetical protein